MSDWDSQCKQFKDQYKCLSNLAITSPEGTVYGTSSPEFVISPDVVGSLNAMLQGSSDTSLTFQGNKFIKLQSDTGHSVVTRCGKKAIICYATPKTRLIAETDDTSGHNLNPGNVAMSAISQFYSSNGF